MDGSSVVAYSLEAGGARQAAELGIDWTGPDRTQNPNGGRFNWTDTDGDGLVDWNGVGSGIDGEVKWDIPLGQNNGLGYSFAWVDNAGNIWITDASQNLIKIPFEGFTDSTNGKRNPVYNWADRQIVVPFQQYGFASFEVRVAGNGDIYALGYNVTPTKNTYMGINGADWIARFNSVWRSAVPGADDRRSVRGNRHRR